MKLISRTYIVFLLSVFFICSCTDEEIVKSGNYDIEEGIPVAVSLNFGVQKGELVTRTGANTTVENTVTDLFVIAFNSNGQISSYRSESGNNVSGGLFYDEESSVVGVTQGEITGFTMLSGAGQTIYAVANVNSGYTNLSSTDLLAFTGNEDEFLNLTCSLTASNQTQVDRGIFVMSGNLSEVSVDKRGDILTPSNPSIPLNRLEARITFKIKVEGDATHQELTFTPRYYRVHQISQGSYLFPKTKGIGENDSWDYITAGYQSMTTSTKNFDETDDADLVGFFEFYVWENRRTPKKRIEDNSTDGDMQADIQAAENLYALREKREEGAAVSDVNKPGQEYQAGDFKYANKNSTYVEFVGDLYYKNEDELEVSADVTYFVHLGNTGNDGNNETSVNNYDTERNTHYTYNITLKGVNSMYVEVYEDKEQRPGMEGNVTATQRTLTFDAHYGRTSFTLNRADFTGEGRGLSWSINTPFQTGTKEFHAENYLVDGVVGTEEQLKDSPALQTDINLNDYRWIQFVINSEAIKENGSRVASNEFAKYPGYRAYSTTDLDAPASAFGNGGWHHSGRTAYYSQNVPMYDINQLLNHLYIEASNENSNVFDADGNVTITAFIDEYIYIYDPTQVFYRLPVATTAENLSLWKNVVNSTNRTLSISYGIGRQYSPDGNTSWQTATITFSQMPIRTFYDPYAQGLTSAWGTESIVEGKTEGQSYLPTYPAPSRLTAENSSMNNGRENTLKIIPQYGNLRWSQVLQMETSNWGELDSNYRSMWYACLGRNRDLNGDDIVQEDEIRWYLASIDQLTDLWIGDEALPDMAKLYDVSEVTSTVPNRHVASSTMFDNNNVDDTGQKGNVWMIWAEEGASRGDVNRSYDYNETNLNYDYRCVRNLGISLANIETEPDDYVTTTGPVYNNSRREYRIDVSKLNVNALRAASPNQVLERHTEREYYNRPASQFAVLIDDDNVEDIGNNWNSIISESGNYWSSNRICPSGYRLPNQRELLLLSMYFGPDQSEYDNLFKSSVSGNRNDRAFYVAKTEYGFANIVSGERPGFAIESADDGAYTFVLLNGLSHPYYARCVRDVN